MRRVGLLCVLCFVALCVVLAGGCPKIADEAAERSVEQAIERASGGEVDVQLEGDEMTFTDTETGETRTIATGAGQMPEGWPEALPQYPGSEIVAGDRIASGEKVSFHVQITTADPGTGVAEFYKEKALGAGYELAHEVTSNNDGSCHFVGSDYVFDVIYSVQEGKTTVNLMLLPSDEQAPPEPEE